MTSTAARSGSTIAIVSSVPRARNAAPAVVDDVTRSARNVNGTRNR